MVPVMVILSDPSVLAVVAEATVGGLYAKTFALFDVCANPAPAPVTSTTGKFIPTPAVGVHCTEP